MSPRVVVVTGGSRGMGREMCRGFAAQGDTVVVASRKADACEALAADSGPMVDAATDRATAYLVRRWPDLDPGDVALATETAARLTVSHLVLPRHPAERVAEQVATVVVRILRRA